MIPNKTAIVLLILAFIVGFVGFWYLTGYQAEWDVEKLRRMVIIRVGFSITIGCFCMAGVCLLQVITSLWNN